MSTVEMADKHEFAACLDLRIRVFVEEQGVPRDEEEDGLDSVCTHFLAKVDGQPVGTARLRLVEDGTAKAERVAVLAAHRRSGLGQALMQALEAEAFRRGAPSIRLNAQVSAIPFYEATGYVASGGVFDDAGIPHQAMTKALPGGPSGHGRVGKAEMLHLLGH